MSSQKLNPYKRSGAKQGGGGKQTKIGHYDPMRNLGVRHLGYVQIVRPTRETKAGDLASEDMMESTRRRLAGLSVPVECIKDVNTGRADANAVINYMSKARGRNMWCEEKVEVNDTCVVQTFDFKENIFNKVAPVLNQPDYDMEFGDFGTQFGTNEHCETPPASQEVADEESSLCDRGGNSEKEAAVVSPEKK